VKDEAAPTTTPTVSWLRGFDGIRGVAALMIVLAHTITFLKAEDYAAPGLLGKVYVVCTQSLTMFFLLSGFLLYRPFVKSIVQRRPLPNVRDYYRGRVLRIYPANIVIVLVAGLLLGVTVTRLLPFGDDRLVDIGRLTDPGTLAANLLLVQGYFPHTVLTGLDASWSLVVEAMFYLVLPPLAWLGLRLSRRMPALAAAAVLAGCGGPTGSTPDRIDASDVPYGLTSPSPGSPAATSSPAREDRPRVYLVGPDDVLVPSGREVSGTSTRERLDDLLGQLADGPTTGERDDALTTALPPRVDLMSDVDAGGTATIDFSTASASPAGEQTRRAVGQIVLTATSLPGVTSVLLTHDGEPLEAPLPSGELTTDPLTAADYEPLLVAPPS